ncbi:hypothetical protein BJX99DRAFT_267419 [Aspergillus californicus]
MTSRIPIDLSPAKAGVYHTSNLGKRSAETANELLHQNHELFHIFFNDQGFHNHIAHYLLTAFAIGATPDQLQRMYDDQKLLQRPPPSLHGNIPQNMHDGKVFREHLGNQNYYQDYLRFFESQISIHGWENVLQDHLFSRSENAELVLTRMFASFLHPIIHLGFGVEFQQPAIIAEALAQAAIHVNDVAAILYAMESASAHQTARPMLELIDAARRNEKIRDAPCWGNGFGINDDAFLDAPEELVQIAAQWRVLPEEHDLAEKTAEMINTNAFFVGASQAPPKEYKLDFYLIHNVNCSIFFSAMLNQDWLSLKDKARLLEWKGRFDILSYVSRGSPQLLGDEITAYRSKRPKHGWEDLFQDANKLEDDSHVCKLIRALANGSVVCKPYEGKDGARFPTTAEMWLQIARMAIDTTENVAYEDRWVKAAGFKASWDKFANR